MARVLYRDALMLVIDKPAGVPVHAGPKNADSKNAASKRAGNEAPPLDASFDALRFGLPRPPALAHRLDRDTSGCLVLGRHRRALAQLSELFRENKVGKTYFAVVEGGPEADEGEIDLPLARRDASRGWWMKVAPDGLPSLTYYRVLSRKGPLACLALKPVTGRTHQLRVHCATSGWPILGDPIYGNGPRFGGPGLHLHAREISVPLSRNKPPITVTAPLPPHMEGFAEGFGLTPPEAPARPAP